MKNIDYGLTWAEGKCVDRAELRDGRVKARMWLVMLRTSFITKFPKKARYARTSDFLPVRKLQS